MLLLLVLAMRAAEAQTYFAPTGKPDPYNPAGGSGQRYPLSPGTPGYGGQVIAHTGELPPVPNFAGQTAPQTSPPQALPPNYPAGQRYPLPTATPLQPQYAPPAYPPRGVAPTSNPPIEPPSGSQPIAGQLPAGQPPAGQPAAEQALFQPGQIVATVGNQYILYGDVLPITNQLIESELAKATSPQQREEIEGFRDKLDRHVTQQLVEAKLMYFGFIRDVESKAPRDKLAELRERINKKTAESFETKFTEMREKVATGNREEIADMMKQDAVLARLALLMKEKKLETMAQLDAELRRVGSSLQKQQRAYKENGLGRMHIGDKLRESVSQEVTHQEMLDYYKGHPEKYGVKARAKFEIITCRFSNHPSREAARQKLAALGNEIFLGGAQFGAVAKKGSEEPNASAGGRYDWTTKGSLASEPIDHALFTLPTGSLSQMIEDELGCHIMRVMEREDAGFIPFLEAQKGIKEAIIQSRREKAYKDILKGISDGVAVWTIYDEPNKTAQQNEPAATVQR
jgi:parvulin-like peptidyl-prolyl isomerase